LLIPIFILEQSQQLYHPCVLIFLVNIQKCLPSALLLHMFFLGLDYYVEEHLSTSDEREREILFVISPLCVFSAELCSHIHIDAHRVPQTHTKLPGHPPQHMHIFACEPGILASFS
jgi:hypothetical protein